MWSPWLLLARPHLGCNMFTFWFPQLPWTIWHRYFLLLICTLKYSCSTVLTDPWNFASNTFHIAWMCFLHHNNTISYKKKVLNKAAAQCGYHLANLVWIIVCSFNSSELNNGADKLAEQRTQLLESRRWVNNSVHAVILYRFICSEVWTHLFILYINSYIGMAIRVRVPDPTGTRTIFYPWVALVPDPNRDGYFSHPRVTRRYPILYYRYNSML
jgi:hypothetical protein